MTRYTAWALIGVAVLLIVLAEIRRMDDDVVDQIEQQHHSMANQ